MRRNLPILLTALALCAGAALRSAEIKPFSGAGEATAEKAFFGQEKENQKALDRAQQNAVRDALKGALEASLGTAYQLDPERKNALLKDLEAHDSTFIRDQAVVEAGMDGLTARTKLVVKVDMGAMKDYLKRQGLSLTSGLASKFKFFVLSYTVEGMDPDFNKPVVLHEEVRAESQNAQSANFSSSSSASASFQGSHADQAVVVGPYGGAAAASAGAVKSASDSSSQTAAGYANSGSSSYIRVIDYADPTRKDLAATNAVRAMLEGTLHRADLKVATVSSPVVGQEFKSEDEFVNKVLDWVRHHAQVEEDDCVAIALNRLTPLPTNGGYRFNSTVTLRCCLVKDGTNLLDSQAISRTSSIQSSADAARTQAINLCVGIVNDTLPQQVRKLMQDLQSLDSQAAAPPAGIFTIRITNVQERAVLQRFRAWLRQQGFTFKSETKGGGTVENFVLTLGDRSPEDIKDALDGMPADLLLQAKNDAGAVLQVR